MTEIIELDDVNVFPTDAEPGVNGSGSKDVQQKTAEGTLTGSNRVEFFATADDDDTEHQLRKIESYPGAKKPGDTRDHVESDDGRASRQLQLHHAESCPDGGTPRSRERPHISLCQVLIIMLLLFYSS